MCCTFRTTKYLFGLSIMFCVGGTCYSKSFDSDNKPSAKRSSDMTNAFFFRPIKSPDDWRQLVANPKTQWRDGYSAKSLATTWFGATDFPMSIKSIFNKSQFHTFNDVELLAAFPEYPVPLPGGGHASQNDLFVLAKGDRGLVSVMVEGKVSENFGETVQAWKKDSSAGKRQRLNFMITKLGLETKEIETIRYQLLHRTVSALIQAERFTAQNALVLIHSFSSSQEHFDDYAKFLTLFNVVAEKESIVGPIKMSGVDVFFCWATEPSQTQVR